MLSSKTSNTNEKKFRSLPLSSLNFGTKRDLPIFRAKDLYELKGLSYRSYEAIDRARSIYVGESLILAPEENINDSNAIAVYTKDGYHIGYIGREYAARIKKAYDFINDCTVAHKSNTTCPYILMSVTFYDGVIKEDLAVTKRYLKPPSYNV